MCNSKRLLTIVMVVVMLLTLAVSASALPIGTSAGVYGTLGGIQNWKNGEDVVTGTTITSNPDNAYLKATVDLYNSVGTIIRSTAHSSASGVKSFQATHLFAYYITQTPSSANIAHEVKGGAHEYAHYTSLAYSG